MESPGGHPIDVRRSARWSGPTTLAKRPRYAASSGWPPPRSFETRPGRWTPPCRWAVSSSQPRFTGSLSSAAASTCRPSARRLCQPTSMCPRSALHATDIEATVAPTGALGPGRTNIRGNVSADLASRGLSGQFALDTPSAADLLERPARGVAPRGTVGGDRDLGRHRRCSRGASPRSHGSGLSLSGQPIDSIDAKTRVVDGGVTVESLTLRQGKARFARRGGTPGRTAPTPWTSPARTCNGGARWRGWATRRPASGSSSLAAGDIDHPTGVGVIEFAVAGGLAGELIDKGIANVRLDGESARVTGTIPSLGAFINATIQPASAVRVRRGHRDEPDRSPAGRHAGRPGRRACHGHGEPERDSQGSARRHHAIAGVHQPAGHLRPMSPASPFDSHRRHGSRGTARA